MKRPLHNFWNVKRVNGTIFLALLMCIVLSPFSTTKLEAQNCTVNAGVADTVCASNQYIINGKRAGLYTGTMVWSQYSGPTLSIATPSATGNVLNSNVNGYGSVTTKTRYIFKLSSTCADGSHIWDTVSVYINPISIANAGPDQTLCAGVTGVLAANAPGLHETGHWNYTLSEITLANANSPTSTFVLPANGPGTVQLTWVITHQNGCSTFDNVIIYNRGGVSPVDAGPDQLSNLGPCYSGTLSTTLAGTFPGNNIDNQHGLWTVVNGPSIPTFSNASSASSSVSNLVPGRYVFRWTVSGPCVNGTDTVVVVVPPPVGAVTSASAGGNQSFCDGRLTFLLSGNNPSYINETGVWTQTGGSAATIATPGSPTTVVTVPAATGPYTFKWTITNSVTGCTTNNSSTISYLTAPTLSISATNYMLNCNDSTASIPYTKTGSGTLQYTILSGPTNWKYTSFPTTAVNAGGSPSQIPNLSAPGTYIVRFSLAEGTGNLCATVFKDVLITTSRTPESSNSGTPQILGCNITQTRLQGNLPRVGKFGKGHWSQISGPNGATFENQDLDSTRISSLIPGLYRFRWIISSGPMCPVTWSDTRVIVSNGTPTAASAGVDSTICYGTPYYLQGNTPNYQEVGTWTVIPSAGVSFSPDNHAPDALVTGLSPNTVYRFIWGIVNACGSSADTAYITTGGTQGPKQANAGANKCLASGPITLIGNDPSPGTGLWTMLSGPGGTITNPTNDTTTVTGVSSGTYTFEWKLSFNSCTDSRDTVMITISPSVTLANAGGDRNICGDTLRLWGNTPGPGETGTWTQTLGNADDTIQGIHTPHAYVTHLTEGVYRYKWTITHDACPTINNADSVDFHVSIPPTPSAAGSDIVVCNSNSATLSANTPLKGTGIWNLISGPSTPTITTLSNPNATISPLLTGVYKLQWIIRGGVYCPVSRDTVLVTVYTKADAGSDKSFCDETETILTGNAGSTGTWTQVIGPNTSTITTINSNTAKASGLITGTYNFRYAVSYPGPCISADTMAVIVSGQPTTPAAGNDTVLCNATVFNLKGNAPAGGQTGLWTKLSGPSGSFTNATSPNATFTPGATKYGIFEFAWTITDGACSKGDKVIFTNYQPPSPSVGGPKQDPVCDTVIVMAATAPAVGLGAWTQISGPNTAFIQSTIMPNTTISGLIPGWYRFRWTVSNGPVCPPNTSDVYIHVHTQPSVPFAGTDQLLCNQDSTILHGNTISVGAGTWTKISGPNTPLIVSPNNPNTHVRNLIIGTYIFRWTSLNDSCSKYDEVSVINSAPMASANAGPNQYVCQYQPVTLSGSNPSPGTGLWTLVSGPTSVYIVTPTAQTTPVYGMDLGNYVFKWRITNGGCKDSSLVTISINKNPTQASTGPAQVLCNLTTATLTGNTPLIGTGLWNQVFGPSIVSYSDQTSPSAIISGLVPGVYKFTWTITNATCTSQAELVITVHGLPTVAVAGPNQTRCGTTGTNNITLTMAANTPVVGTGAWSLVSKPVANPTPVFTTPASPTTTITGVGYGTYVFRWTITNGTCPASTSDVTCTINHCAPFTFNEQLYMCTGSLTKSVDVLANGDYSPEGRPLSVTHTPVLGPALGGTFVWTSGSTFTYTPPNSSFAGNDKAIVSVCDDNGYCTNDTVFIHVVAAVAADAGPNQYLCQSYQTFLTGNFPPTGSVGNWTYVSGPSVVNPTPSNSPVATVSNLIASANPTSNPYVFLYTISSTYSGVTCTDTAIVKIFNYHYPTLPNAGQDKQLCTGTLGGTVCTTLNGNNPTYGHGVWSVSPATGVTFSPDKFTRNAVACGMTSESNGALRDYYFHWTIGNGSVCDSVQDDVVISVSGPPAANTGVTSATVCEGSSYPMNLASASNFTAVYWTTTGDGAFNSPQGVIQPVYTPGPNDILTGVVTLTIHAVNTPCSDATSSVVLHINKKAVASAGPDDIICQSSSASYTYTVNGASASNYASLVWTATGPGTITSNATTLHPVYTTAANQSGIVKFYLSVTGNSQCSNVLDTMILNIVPKAIVWAGPDTTVCESSNYYIGRSTASNYSSLSWMTSGTGYFNNPLSLHPTYIPSQTDIQNGSVTLTIQLVGLTPCANISDDMILHFSRQTVASAGPDMTICQVTTAPFTIPVNGATASNYSGLLWHATGPGAISTGAATLNPVYLTASGQTGIVKMWLTASSNAPCIPVTDTMYITIIPKVVATAGNDATICETAVSYTLNTASAQYYSQLTWTTMGTGNFNNEHIVNPVYTPSPLDIQNGSVKLVLHVSGVAPCADVVDTMLLSISRQALANAGADVTICQGNTGYTYTINGATASLYTSLQWYEDGVGSITANGTTLHPVYTPTASETGVVHLWLVAKSGSPCIDAVDTMKLTIVPKVVASAGQDGTICETGTFYVSTSSAQNYSAIDWTTSGTGYFNNEQTIHPTYVPSTADINAGSVILTMHVTGLAPCSDFTGSFTLTIKRQATANAGQDAMLCQDAGNFTITTASATNYTTIQWTAQGPGNLTASTTINPVYHPAVGQTGTVKIWLTANSASPCLNVTDTMLLTITPKAIAWAGPDTTICESSSYYIGRATAQNYSAIDWWTSGTGYFNNETTVHPTYIPSTKDIQLGLVKLVMHLTANQPCVDAIDTMYLHITHQAVADAGADVTICQGAAGYTYTVNGATASNYSSLQWMENGAGSIISGATTLNPVYQPTAGETGTVKLWLRARSSSPCIDVVDTMRLTIVPKVVASAGSDATICETAPSYYISGSSAINYSTLMWTTSGTGNFNNDQILHPTYTPSTADIVTGSVTLTMVVTGLAPCSDYTGSFMLNIKRQAVVNAGNDVTVCQGNSGYTVTLSNGASQLYASTYQWYEDGLGSITSGGNTLNPVYTPTASETGKIHMWLVANSTSPCMSAADTMALTIVPKVVATAGQDATICETGNYPLSTASALNFTAIDWTTSGTGTFNNEHTINPVYTPSHQDAVNGSVTLTMHVYGLAPCADFTGSMVLHISRQAIVDAGADATICQGPTGYTFTVNGATASLYSTLVWNADGPGTLTNVNSINPVYHATAGQYGTVKLWLTGNSVSPCVAAVDTMRLTIIQKVVASAGQDATICETGNYPLSTASALNFSAIDWTTSGTGTFNNEHTINPIYTPSHQDAINGSVTLTMHVYGLAPCADFTGSMVLHISRQAVVDAGADATICQGPTGYTFTVNGAAASFYSSLVWNADGPGILTNANSLNPVYHPTASQTGTVKLWLTGNSVSPCVAAVDTMRLTIVPKIVASAGSDATICETGTFYVSTSSAVNFSAIEWTTSGTGYFNNAQTIHPTYVPSIADINAGSVILTMHVTGLAPCSDFTGSFTLTISRQAVVDAGADAVICQGTGPFTVMNASASHFVQLVWNAEGPGTLSFANSLHPIYTPTPGQTGVVKFWLTGTSTQPCVSATDSMTLTITPKASGWAGSDTTICESSYYTNVRAWAQNYATFEWKTLGTGYFSDDDVINSTYIPSTLDISNGSVKLILNVYGNEPCGMVSDTMTLNISRQATANAGQDAIICQDAGDFAITTANASFYTSIVWNAEGPGMILPQTANTLNPVYHPAQGQTGTVKIWLTAVSSLPCVSVVDTMHLTITPKASGWAGKDTSICETTTYLNNLAWALNYSDFEWKTTGTGTFNDDNAIHPIYTPSAADIIAGNVKLILNIYGNAPCGMISDSMSLHISRQAMTEAGQNEVFCNDGKPVAITHATASNYTSLLWTAEGPGALTGNTNNLVAYYQPAPGQSGTVKLWLTAFSAGPCVSVIDSMTLTLYLPPIAEAGPDTTICETSNYFNLAATAQNYTSVEWKTLGTGTFNDNTILNPIYTPSAVDIAAGSVKLILRAYGDAPCGMDADTMVIHITHQPIANAGPDSRICESSDFCLCEASAFNYVDLFWTTTGTGRFTNPNSLNPYYIPSPADILEGCVKLVLHLTATPPCTTVTDTMTLCISRIPVVYAGKDTTICETAIYTNLDATAKYQASIKWTTMGDGHFDNDTVLHNTYIPGVNDVAVGHVKLVLEGIGCSPCPNAWDTMQIFFARRPVVVALVVAHVNCFGENNGSVTASVTGGHMPFYYIWSDPASQTTQTAVGLYAGTYTVTVTDYYSCTTSSQVTVTEPPLLTSESSLTHVTCNSFINGAVHVTVNGGTPDNTFMWSNGTTTKDLDPIGAGTYTVTVTDSHGCTTVTGGTVTEPPALLITNQVLIPVNCHGEHNGSVFITVEGGTPDYSYNWSNSATTQNIENIPEGTYTVTVTDSHGCVTTGTGTITEPDLLVYQVHVTDVTCNSACNGVIDISPSGGTPAYTYAWSNTATTQSISNVCAGTYTLTLTDAHGCTASSEITVTEPPYLYAISAATNISCYTYNNGTVDVTVYGGTPDYSFNWNTGATTQNIANLSPGTYTVTVTDSHGCTATTGQTVSEPPAWSPCIAGTVELCQGATAQYCICPDNIVAGFQSRPGSTFQWTVIGGTIIDGCCGPCVTILWDHCNVGKVCVTETRHDYPYEGCRMTTCIDVILNPVPNPVITGPSFVTTGQIGTQYCTANVPGHLYNWSVVGGTVSGGQGTNCITIDWTSICQNCTGKVIVYESFNGCCGIDTLEVSIIPGQGNLTGYVTYDNPYSTGLNGVDVQLYSSSGVLLSTVTTGPNTFSANEPGFFAFSNITNGNYTLKAHSNGTFGGNNATDALIVQLNVIGSYPLTNFRKLAADVNGSQFTTALDALYIKLRTVGMINSYPAGDWLFTDTTFALSTTAGIDLKGICFGDVNGSYIPNGFKEASFLSPVEDGIITVPVNEPFNYEIRSSVPSELGAMTLFMDYDQTKFTVEKVNSNLDGMKYVIGKGQVSLAWSDTKPLSVKANEPVLSFQVKANEPISQPSQIFTIHTGSEFADINANKYDNFDLKLSSILTTGTDNKFSMINYPNPFRNTTTIVYTMPEAGHVNLVLTDMFGKQIRTLVNENQTAGVHKVIVDPLDVNLTAGVYLYKIEVNGSADTYSKVNKMLFTR